MRWLFNTWTIEFSSCRRWIYLLSIWSLLFLCYCYVMPCYLGLYLDGTLLWWELSAGKTESWYCLSAQIPSIFRQCGTFPHARWWVDRPLWFWMIIYFPDWPLGVTGSASSGTDHQGSIMAEVNFEGGWDVLPSVDTFWTWCVKTLKSVFVYLIAMTMIYFRYIHFHHMKTSILNLYSFCFIQDGFERL